MHALVGVCARVDAVSSGEEAIAAVRQHDSDRPYDVIFMDWRMPGMDGIQAARLIKEDPYLTTRPAVVLVTAFGREEVREEAERIQMDGYLLKPVTASMLFDTLVALFAGASHDRTALAPVGDRHADRLRGLRVLWLKTTRSTSRSPLSCWRAWAPRWRWRTTAWKRSARC